MTNEITLEQMYGMQSSLDARIIKEKGLEGKDLLPNTVLALLVEISECANEWRGFKHWSDKRQPKYGYVDYAICPRCDGKGAWYEGERVKCPICPGDGKIINPLLEEYVDCFHFFLSIAVQKEWLEHLYLHEDAIEDVRENGLDGGIGGAILEVIYWLSKFHMEKKELPEIKEKLGCSTEVFYFRSAWSVFIMIGMIGFGWTWEQISQAYVSKNQINHKRQDQGY